MRYQATATCLSWIPPTAVEGAFSLPFGLGIAHYDQPPPDELPDLEALLSADAIRFANQLHAWIEVTDGQVTGHGMSGSGRLGSTTVRLGSHGLTFAGVALPGLTPPPEVHQDRVHFTHTAGGHTGAPVPRAVPHPPFWQLTAPIAWSTITLTLHSDGSSKAQIAAASPPARPRTAAPAPHTGAARPAASRAPSPGPGACAARRPAGPPPPEARSAAGCAAPAPAARCVIFSSRPGGGSAGHKHRVGPHRGIARGDQVGIQPRHRRRPPGDRPRRQPRLPIRQPHHAAVAPLRPGAQLLISARSQPGPRKRHGSPVY